MMERLMVAMALVPLLSDMHGQHPTIAEAASIEARSRHPSELPVRLLRKVRSPHTCVHCHCCLPRVRYTPLMEG